MTALVGLLVACAPEPEPESQMCRPDEVYFQDIDGVRTDWTDRFRGDLTLDEPGTWQLCEGRWSVTLEITGRNVSIVGLGPEQSVLDGEGGTVVTARNLLGDGLLLQDLSIAGGLGHWEGEEVVGGGLHVDGGRVTLSGVDLHHNRGVRGGALAALDAEVVLDGVRIEENQADDFGAGIHVAGGELVFDDLVLRENEAGYAAGLHAMGPVQGVGVLFEDNRARGMGGGMLVSADVRLERAAFHGNTSEESVGGAIAVHGGDLELVGASLWDNHAASGAGGVSIENFHDTLVDATNVHFGDNQPADVCDVNGDCFDLGESTAFSCDEGGCR